MVYNVIVIAWYKIKSVVTLRGGNKYIVQNMHIPGSTTSNSRRRNI